MFENIKVGSVGFLGLRMETCRLKYRCGHSSITKYGQKCVPVNHFVFTSMSVIRVFIHHSCQNLIDIHIVNISQKCPHDASLLLAIHAICHWKWNHGICWLCQYKRGPNRHTYMILGKQNIVGSRGVLPKALVLQMSSREMPIHGFYFFTFTLEQNYYSKESFFWWRPTLTQACSKLRWLILLYIR